MSWVSSGRWSIDEGTPIECEQDEVEVRMVSESEALSGIGTYVGSTVCIARVPRGAAKSWDYGTVVGYDWNDTADQGSLDIIFADETAQVTYNEASMQDLAVETYALRPCAARGVREIMASEMRALHQRAYDMFNGTDGTAVRDSNAIATALNAHPPDESALVPLFDITRSEVSPVPIRHILDFVYYHDSGRDAPLNVSLGATIFESSPPVDNNTARPGLQESGALHDQLSDSGQDSDGPGTGHAPLDQVLPPQAKRLRVDHSRQARAGGNAHAHSLQSLRSRATENPQLLHDIDQLIRLHQVGFPSDASALSVPSVPASEVRAQFRPTGMQLAVHQALIDGSCGSVCILSAPCCAAWSFRLGVWSLRSFRDAFCTNDSAREAQGARKYDMTDFSRKNALPAPMPALNFSALLDAIDIIAYIANQLYKPMVEKLIQAARQFLLELRADDMPHGENALSELTNWLDERLEKFRVAVADGDITKAIGICQHFCISHESFARVDRLIMHQKLEFASRRAAPSTTTSSARGNGNWPRDNPKKTFQRVEIPLEVIKAIPKEDGKECTHLSSHTTWCYPQSQYVPRDTNASEFTNATQPHHSDMVSTNEGRHLIASLSADAVCSPKFEPRIDYNARSVPLASAQPIVSIFVGDIVSSLRAEKSTLDADAYCSLKHGKLNHLIPINAPEETSDTCASSSPAINVELFGFIVKQRAALAITVQARKCLLQHHLILAAEQLNLALRARGLDPPKIAPASHRVGDQVSHLIDYHKQHVYSEFIRRSGMELPEFVRLLRGESMVDSRPNKALEIPEDLHQWDSYPFKEDWTKIVTNGIVPVWKVNFPYNPSHPQIMALRFKL